jgi:hypothetical protein
MDYPDWKETREGMWAAHRNFPMLDDETPTFMARPLAAQKSELQGADVVIIGSPYVSNLVQSLGRRPHRAGKFSTISGKPNDASDNGALGSNLGKKSMLAKLAPSGCEKTVYFQQAPRKSASPVPR